MSAVSHSRQNFAGLNLMQLVRRLAPVSGRDDSELLNELGKHVRFRGHISYQHPRHEVAHVDARQQPVEVFLNDNVLASLLGPLPAPYLELCHQRMRDGDPAMAVFLDIFNHRLNALRYCMKARSSSELTFKEPQHALPGELLNAINGDPLRQVGEGEGAPLDGRHLLGLAGLLHQNQRSHSVVQLLLRRLVGLPLELTAFEGGWLPLDEDQQNRLGFQNSRLGSDAVLGSHCWDQHKALGLNIEVPDYHSLRGLLPGGERYRWFCRLVRWLTHYRFDVNVRLRLSARAGDGIPLVSDPELAARLSYTSWLSPLGEQDGDQPSAPYRVASYTISALGGENEHAA